MKTQHHVRIASVSFASFASFTAFLTIAAALPAAAAVPDVVTYAGTLKQGAAPADGTFTVVLEIFDAETAGSRVFAQTESSLAVSAGELVVDLGSDPTNPLSDDVLATGSLFLQITVNGEILDPRVPFTSVPFARRAKIAEDATTLAGLSPDDVANLVSAGAGLTSSSTHVFSLADHGVTAQNIADGAVGTAALANASITAAKLQNGIVGPAQLAAGSVTHAAVAVNAVDNTQLADNSVDARVLANGSVNAAELADQSVDTNALIDGSVTAAKIAQHSIAAAQVKGNVAVFIASKGAALHCTGSAPAGSLTTVGGCGTGGSCFLSDAGCGCIANLPNSGFCDNTEVGVLVPLQ